MIVNILVWAVFGLVAGAVVQFLMPGKDPGQSADPKGFLITIVLGIVGAVVGGFIASQVFNWDINTFSIAGFAVAVGGAILLLILYRLLMSARRAV